MTIETLWLTKLQYDLRIKAELLCEHGWSALAMEPRYLVHRLPYDLVVEIANQDIDPQLLALYLLFCAEELQDEVKESV